MHNLSFQEKLGEIPLLCVFEQLYICYIVHIFNLKLQINVKKHFPLPNQYLQRFQEAVSIS